MEFMSLNIGIKHSMKWKEMPISSNNKYGCSSSTYINMHFEQREFVTRK